MERRLALHFNTLETRLRAEVETSATLRRRRLETAATLLPQLQKQASDCRMKLSHLKHDMADEGHMLRFLESRESFIDILYGVQLFLQPTTYEVAHLFKGLLDRIDILLCRGEHERATADIGKTLERPLAELEEVYSRLQLSLRQEFLRLSTDDVDQYLNS